MPPMEWMLEIVLVGMLGVTLFHAVRLERALGVLKRDRATLEALIASFNDSTRQAEQGIERLRAPADGAGRQIARQAEAATAPKDDLGYLTERGDRSPATPRAEAWSVGIFAPVAAGHDRRSCGPAGGEIGLSGTRGRRTRDAAVMADGRRPRRRAG